MVPHGLGNSCSVPAFLAAAEIFLNIPSTCQGLGCGVKAKSVGFRVWGLGFEVWGLGYEFWGVGLGFGL